MDRSIATRHQFPPSAERMQAVQVGVSGPSRHHTNDVASSYKLSHLGALEAQSIYIMREVAAEFERPALLFSGGKDSIVMLHLARKAFWPARCPFRCSTSTPGATSPRSSSSAIARWRRIGLRLVVGSVQDDIDAGRISDEAGPERRGTSCRPRRCCGPSASRIRRPLRWGPP